ncbi:MAG: helix-turn-helix transcriptional regulator [Ignavibacteria bacterium]|nr:helix-turn-helix transcriptional regulator [Ignavibacteria bacterium]
MQYRTFEPSKDLAALVKCYWTLESPKEDNPPRQRIVPDGCMEMIFHYGDLYRQYTNETNSIIQPRCFVIGQLTRPLEIQPTGATGIFSVRFHPEGFTPFATRPVKELENRAVALEQLFGKEGADLGHNTVNASTTPGRIDIVERFLTTRLTDTRTIDRVVQSTVETILTANGRISVDELSEQVRVNRRQLERRFSSAIGLSPKQLSKTIRLQAALRLLANGKFSSLTTLAHEGEYYDQAHFIKDFREFTGLTPKEFYSEHLTMSSLFYGTD